MANDFSGDSNCVALYNLESGALTTDSKGSNTLTDVNTVAANTTQYKQGAASADFETSSTERLYRTDANLSTDFPFKSGQSNNLMSVCFWAQFEAVTTGATYLVCKYAALDNQRSWAIKQYSSGNILASFGYGTSSYTDIEVPDLVCNVGGWYHFGFTYNNTNGAYWLRVYDEDADTVYELTGTFANYSTFTVGAAAFTLGSRSDGSGYHDGELDEVVVFNDILTADEIDDIRNGVYGAGSAVSGSIAESFGITDSIGRTARFGAGISDALVITDTQTPLALLLAGISDTLVFVDSQLTGVAHFVVSIGDVFSVSDLSDSSRRFYSASSDVLSLSETIIKLAQRLGNISDTDVLTDALATQLVYLSSISDPIPLIDVVAGFLAGTLITGQSSDTLPLNDSIAVYANLLIQAVSYLQMFCAIGAVADKQASLSDSMSLSDALSITRDLIGLASDPLVLGELITRYSQKSGAVSEQLSLTDSTPVTVNLHIQASDTLQILDTANKVASFLKSVTEQFSISDYTIDIFSLRDSLILHFSANKLNFTFDIGLAPTTGFAALSKEKRFTATPQITKFTIK